MHVVNSILVNLQLTQRDDLIRLFIGALDRLARNEFPAILIQAFMRTKNAQVQRDALKFMAHCANEDRRCGLTHQAIVALAQPVKDTPVFGSLVRTAGHLRLGPISEWCDGNLGDDALGRACRTALSHAQSQSAFETLHAFVLQRHRDPRSRQPQVYSFRDDFALIVPYASADYAKAKFYALLNAVLGETRRSPYATAGVAKHLGSLEDKGQSRTLAEIHLRRYEALWPAGKRNEAQTFLIATLKTQLNTLKSAP